MNWKEKARYYRKWGIGLYITVVILCILLFGTIIYYEFSEKNYINTISDSCFIGCLKMSKNVYNCSNVDFGEALNECMLECVELQAVIGLK